MHINEVTLQYVEPSEYRDGWPFAIRESSSSSSQVFLEWPKQQHHHEDHYSQSKYSRWAESANVVTAWNEMKWKCSDLKCIQKPRVGLV